jgi:hypothetical protein
LGDRRDWPRALLWAALLLLSVPIGAYALRYWSGDPALLRHELRLNLLHNPPAFMLHTSFGGLALLLAPSTGHGDQVADLQRGVAAFRVTDRLYAGDRAKLMRATLTRIYNLSP